MYGPAASGKTNLLLNILKLSSTTKILYVSTEGSLYLERVSQIEPLTSTTLFINVLSMEELLISIMKALTEYWDLLIVDSINNPFRSEVIEKRYALVILNSILAHLRKVIMEKGIYVLLSAQVRAFEEEDEPSGLKYLRFWCDGMLRLERDRKTGLRNIYLVTNKGEIPIASFKIDKSGIRWLQC